MGFISRDRAIADGQAAWLVGNLIAGQALPLRVDLALLISSLIRAGQLTLWWAEVADMRFEAPQRDRVPTGDAVHLEVRCAEDKAPAASMPCRHCAPELSCRRSN